VQLLLQILPGGGNLSNIDLLKTNPNVQIIYEGVKKKEEKTVYDENGKPVKAIVIGVEKKLPLDQLKKSEILPRAIGTKPTDVVEVGKIRALKEAQQEKWRPIKAGISVGHIDITAGTLGAVVLGTETSAAAETQSLKSFWKWLMELIFGKKEDDPDPPTPQLSDAYIISNNHVLANEDRGKIGDPIIQPGDYDDGAYPGDAVAALHEWIPLKPGGVNYVDVALAKIYKDVPYQLGQYGNLPMKPIMTADEVKVGLLVCKTGRTTFYTEGKVTGINASSRIWYDQGEMLFAKLVVIESVNPYPFSQGGDSGSIICDMYGRPVLVLFAGSDYITLGFYIETAMEMLETKFTFG